MSKLYDRLNERFGIINTWDILVMFGKPRVDDVAVSFHGYGPPRSMMVHGASVFSPSHKTDPGSHFMDRGAKKFFGKKADALPKAKQWASEKYSIPEWSPDPTTAGSYIPKPVFDRMIAQLNSTP